MRARMDTQTAAAAAMVDAINITCILTHKKLHSPLIPERECILKMHTPYQ